MLKTRRSRDRARSARDGPEDSRSSRLVSRTLGSDDQHDPPIQHAADTENQKNRKKKQLLNGQQELQQQQEQQQQKENKKKKKKPAIVVFFKRIKLRPLWRRSGGRSRSRSRGRRRPLSTDAAAADEADGYGDVADAFAGRPGALDLRPRPPAAASRTLLSATVLTSLPLDPWGCPYDFAVQGDRLLVPGLEVAEFSLAAGVRRAWPGSLGRYVPLCIDVTPSLVYLTAASQTGCGLFVFDRSGRLVASRLLRSGESDEDDDGGGGAPPPRRPGMFAVRVNFRGECWVTNPRHRCVDHYTAALKQIRSIDVAKFGVPYYLTAHSHRLACLWVSFPESRRVVKFDWLTLEPLCHLAFGAGQTPCGLHLDEWGEQLYVTDIGSGRVLVYHAASMGLAAASTRAANAAVAALSERPAAVRLEGGRLLLLSCSASDRCRVDIYSVTFDDGDDSD